VKYKRSLLSRKLENKMIDDTKVETTTTEDKPAEAATTEA